MAWLGEWRTRRPLTAEPWPFGALSDTVSQMSDRGAEPRLGPNTRAGGTAQRPTGRATGTQVPVLNPFDVSAPYVAVLRIAFALAIVPGLGTGLLLVAIAGLRLPLAIGWPQLAQAHGQIQAIGFVVLFIVAVGLQLFPRFLSAPLTNADRATWGSGLVALSLVARLIGQPLAPGPERVTLLSFAAFGLPLGVLVAASAFHALRKSQAPPPTVPAGAWRRWLAIGGLSLGGALALYVWSGLLLANGDAVVPPNVDEALIHLELAGFAACLVYAVASRVFGRFLLLRTRSALEASIPWLSLLWLSGLLLVSLGWLLAIPAWRWIGAVVELGVLGVWLWIIGLYDRPSRESGTPYITNPTRRWVRLAFVMLVLSEALQVGLFGREVLLGGAPSSTELSAARHALGQGFLLPLMVAMAARLLPIFSADVLKHRLRIELIVDLLLVGAAVRVVAEAAGGYTPVSGVLIALGGLLTWVGFTAFAAGMWSSLGRLPKVSRPAG